MTTTLATPVPLTVRAARPVRVSAGAERMIEGDAVEYGVVGYTSLGPLIYMPGSIAAPAEASRVKLLVQHDDHLPAVGVLADWTEGDRFARARFHVPEGAEGDDALDKAAKGLRDGLSVTTAIKSYRFDGDDNLVVEAAELVEISLVTIPAFSNAGVTSVAANREEQHMTREQLQAQAAGEAVVVEAERQTPAPAVVAEAQAAPPVPAGRTSARGPRTVAEAARAIVGHFQAGRSAAGLSSALGSTIMLAQAAGTLADIVPAHDTADAILPPQFIGEAWQASRTDRPVIDALGTPQRLVSDRIDSWHYVAPADPADGTTAGPEVREYAGSKAAIHTNKWTTEPATFGIYRNAGGWDVDRVYVDLGNSGYIESIIRKATDDSRSDAERYVAEQILLAATDLAAQASVTAALATLGTQAATIGARIDFVSLAPDVWGDFVNLGADEVPWWLQRQGQIDLSTTDGTAGGVRFSVNPELASGSIIAGDRRAVTFYETTPPVAVRAVDIAHGGIDLGVYGYCGLAVHDSRALFATTVA